MLPTLTTPRLCLRWLTGDDVPALFEIFSDPEVMAYWSSPPLADRSGAEKLLAEIHDLAAVGPEARRFLLMGLALTVIGILGKIAAGYVVWKKGLRRTVIGVGMIPRGEVGLIFAQIGLTTKLLSAGLYSAVALMVMLTTFITPPLLRRLLVQKTPDAKPTDFTGEYVMDAPMDRSE